MFWSITGAVLVLVLILLWLGYSRAALPRRLRSVLGREVGVAARPESADLYYRPFPRRLEWNWAAFILGPLWYFLRGLWVHSIILLSLAFVSGGLLIPLVWLYAGLKANEDLLEFRIARKSVY